MMRWLFPVLFATALTGSPALAEANAFSRPPVGDEALSNMRGGFALPGGLDVAIAVQTDTRVNGTLLLRSVFVVDKSAPLLSVFGRTDGVIATGAGTGASGTSTSFTVLGKATEVGGPPEGLTELTLVQGGADVAAAGGSVRMEKAGSGSQVILDRSTLEIRHLSGQAYGSVIANRGNDVTIDTVTNINIDLRNSTPFNLGSTMMRIDALVVDVAARPGR